MSKSADDALAALEKQLGGLSVGDADGFGGGEIEPDDDASTRTAVRYGDAAADPLFDDDGGGAAASTTANALGALGALGGDGAALIAYLEQTAAAFEAESGAPDPELRAKIAQLRAALHGRSAEVEAQASSVAAAPSRRSSGCSSSAPRIWRAPRAGCSTSSRSSATATRWRCSRACRRCGCRRSPRRATKRRSRPRASRKERIGQKISDASSSCGSAAAGGRPSARRT